MGVTPMPPITNSKITLGHAEIESVAKTFEHYDVAHIESIIHLKRTATTIGDTTDHRWW